MPNKKVLGPALIASFGTLFILAAAFVVLRFCGRARAQGNDNDGGKDVERGWTRHLRGGGSAGTADTAMSAGVVVEKDGKASAVGGGGPSSTQREEGRGRVAGTGIGIGMAVGANNGGQPGQELAQDEEVERGRSRTRRMSIEGAG